MHTFKELEVDARESLSIKGKNCIMIAYNSIVVFIYEEEKDGVFEEKSRQ